MALISAFTMIRAIALFHLTVAFYLLSSPKTVADHNLVFLLGASMRLEHISAFNKPSPVTAFLAVVFAFLGISDLAAASLAEEIAIPYWNSQAPVRAFFLFALTSYTYMYKEGGMLANQGFRYKQNVGDNLKNGVVFAWSFMELVSWFWVFLLIRDERRQAAIRLMEKRRAEAARLNL